MKRLKTTNSSTEHSNPSRPFISHGGPGSFFSTVKEPEPPFFGPSTLQPKLHVGQPNSKHEREADSVADNVVNQLNQPSVTSTVKPSIQKKCAECGEEKGKDQSSEEAPELQRKPLFTSDIGTSDETLQRNSDQSVPHVSPKLESKLNSSKGGGSRLPEGTRSDMESAIGTDFSKVRIHTDSSAIQMNRELNARAFAHGSDVYFDQGQYSPSSKEGQRVLAHELTHVKQQGGKARRMLYRTPWTIDTDNYYTDRGGAVVRGRVLQQENMSIDIFQREDNNWQVRYRNSVPRPTSYPHIDAGLYYVDPAAARRRASHLRAYGYVVEVFQRSDDNWQCRLVRLHGSSPSLPTVIGPDPGVYYVARESANRRANALRTAGYEVTVIERADNNFQANITNLPMFNDAAGGAPQAGGTADTEPAEAAPVENAEPAEPVAEPEGGAQADAEPAAEGGGAEELDVHERTANFVTDLNTALEALRTTHQEQLQEAAPEGAEEIEVPLITVTIANRDQRTPQRQASFTVGDNPTSWTCRSGHMGDNARHVHLRIDGAITWEPQDDIESNFSEDFYNDFAEAWGTAMAENDLRNYRGEAGWAPSDAYHLEMPVRNISPELINECVVEYVRLTRGEGETQNASIEAAYPDQIQEAVDALETEE